MKKLIKSATNTSNIGVAPSYIDDIKADVSEKIDVTLKWEGQIELDRLYNWEWITDPLDTAEWIYDHEVDDVSINEDEFTNTIRRAIEPNIPLMKATYDVSLVGTFKAQVAQGTIEIDVNTFKLKNILAEVAQN